MEQPYIVRLHNEAQAPIQTVGPLTRVTARARWEDLQPRAIMGTPPQSLSMSDQPNAQERALLEQCLTGSGSAWRTVFRAFNADVGSFLLGMLPHRETVEDLVQETFLSLLRGLDRHDPDVHLHTAVMRIARDVAIAEGVHTQGRGGTGTQARIQGVLGGIEPVLREAWALRVLADCSVEETSEILDLPEETVVERHRQARRRLLNLLLEAPVVEVHELPEVEQATPDCGPTITWMASQGTGAILDFRSGRTAMSHMGRCQRCVTMRRCHEGFGSQAKGALSFYMTRQQERQMVLAGQLQRAGVDWRKAIPLLVVFALLMLGFLL